MIQVDALSSLDINGKENLILIISIPTLSIFVVFLSVLILICVYCYSRRNKQKFPVKFPKFHDDAIVNL